MAWKFYNIAKANARIDELEAEVAAAKTAKPGDPPADKITTLEKRIEDMATSIAALGDQLSNIQDSASESISADKFSVEIARIDKALGDVTAEKIGTRIAAEITARQGQPPLAGTASGNNGAGDVEQQLQAITDPTKRAQFFKAHEKELKARIQRNGTAAK